MKQLFCLSALLLSFGAFYVNAQDQVPISPRQEVPSKETFLEPSEQTQNMVSLDLARMFGYFNISYTRAITPLFSLSAQVEAPTNLLTGLIAQESGLGIRVEGRFNPMQKYFKGLYIAPVLGINSLVYRPGSIITTAIGTNDFSATTTWFVAGAVVNYQFVPVNFNFEPIFPGIPGILFGVGGGLEVNNVNSSFSGTLPAGFTIPNVTPPGLATFLLPRIRATIGYAW
jgi:hypothetical protein